MVLEKNIQSALELSEVGTKMWNSGTERAFQVCTTGGILVFIFELCFCQKRDPDVEAIQRDLCISSIKVPGG